MGSGAYGWRKRYSVGPFRRDRDLDLFLTMSSEVPAEIVNFVEAMLCEFNGPLLPWLCQFFYFRLPQGLNCCCSCLA